MTTIAYISWAFGNISIRESGTDKVLWAGSRPYSVTQMDQAFEKAEKIAKRKGWKLI